MKPRDLKVFLGVATDLWSRGRRVRFRAEGNSMHPATRRGGAVVAEPAWLKTHVLSIPLSRPSRSGVLALAGNSNALAACGKQKRPAVTEEGSNENRSGYRQEIESY
ncbi:MAG: hypothetical protein ABSC23_19440 [Bryobacteraceae bacterium]|jgi:hypothetical protein